MADIHTLHLHGCLISPHVCSQVHLTDNLGMLSQILETDHFALVVHDHVECKILYTFLIFLIFIFFGILHVFDWRKYISVIQGERRWRSWPPAVDGQDELIQGVNVLKLLLFYQC